MPIGVSIHSPKADCISSDLRCKYREFCFIYKIIFEFLTKMMRGAAEHGCLFFWPKSARVGSIGKYRELSGSIGEVSGSIGKYRELIIGRPKSAAFFVFWGGGGKMMIFRWYYCS